MESRQSITYGVVGQSDLIQLGTDPGEIGPSLGSISRPKSIPPRQRRSRRNRIPKGNLS